MRILKTLKRIGRNFKSELNLYRLVLSDSRMPMLSKLLLGLALGYLALPFDLIPDFLPIIGYLDDLIIVPGLVWLALKFIPAWIVEENRRKVEEKNRE